MTSMSASTTSTSTTTPKQQQTKATNKDKPSRPRPYNRYNIYFILERERLILEKGGATTGTVTSRARPGSASFDSPARGYENLNLPPLPPRFVGLSLDEGWCVPVPGGEKKKRPHRRTHGVASFRELAREIAASWKAVDEVTLTWCSAVEKILKKRYLQLAMINAPADVVSSGGGVHALAELSKTMQSSADAMVAHQAKEKEPSTKKATPTPTAKKPANGTSNPFTKNSAAPPATWVQTNSYNKNNTTTTTKPSAMTATTMVTSAPKITMPARSSSSAIYGARYDGVFSSSHDDLFYPMTMSPNPITAGSSISCGGGSRCEMTSFAFSPLASLRAGVQAAAPKQPAPSFSSVVMNNEPSVASPAEIGAIFRTFSGSVSPEIADILYDDRHFPSANANINRPSSSYSSIVVNKNDFIWEGGSNNSRKVVEEDVLMGNFADWTNCLFQSVVDVDAGVVNVPDDDISRNRGLST